MPNVDYPGVCLSCGASDEECVVAADMSVVRKRYHEMVPEKGFTKFIVNNLHTAMSDKFASPEEAYLALDVVKAAMVNGLKNKNVVDIKGFGEFRVEGGHVVFTPTRELEDAVKE